ncbi:MAG: Hyalin [Parcubacteria group bacterium Gr01-1014_17]|nr:MAG: Hyalin [Parcubacteria group bacterium Gr01-1014_17]
MNRNLLFLFPVFVFLVLGFSAPLAHADGVLGITTISAEKTYAQADGDFAHGWKWVFSVTVPSNEPVLQMKFGNWTSASGTIPVAGNVRFYSAQSSNAASVGSAISVATADTYGSVINLLPSTNSAFDLSTSTAGRQIQITVEARIPMGSVGGSYTTNYGISTTPDTTAPVITLLGTSPVTIERGTAYTDAGATASDTIDGSINSSVVLSGTVTVASIGTYTLSYNASDLAGNAATTVTRTVVVQDTIAPTGTIGYSTTTPTNQNVTATLTPSEPVTVTNNSGATTTTFTNNGSFTFQFADVASNTGSTTATVGNIDKIVPSLTSFSLNGVVQDVAVNIASTTVAVALASSEPVNWLSVKVEKQIDASVYKIFQSGVGCEDGGSSCAKTWTGDVSQGVRTDGVYRVKVHIKDAAGNEFNDYISKTITVDTTAPVITITGNTSITHDFGTTYTDSGATASDTRDGAVSVVSSGSVNVNAEGDYTITYTAADALGNTATATRTVQVRKVLVTSITVTGANNATTISLNGTLQMSVAVLPANATNKSVSWIIGCDNVTNNCPGGENVGGLDGGGTITSAGLLTSIDLGNMRVRAIAVDGSGVSGSVIIIAQ